MMPVAGSQEPAAIKPTNLSMQRYCEAILSLTAALFVSLSLIVQRISRAASRVSTLGATSWSTKS